jgi:hypothetical protein
MNAPSFKSICFHLCILHLSPLLIWLFKTQEMYILYWNVRQVGIHIVSFQKIRIDQNNLRN